MTGQKRQANQEPQAMKIILHKFDPIARIFSGNAFRPGSGGLEAITVREETLKKHCPKITLTALIAAMDDGYAHTINRFNKEWLRNEREEAQQAGEDRVEGYGEGW